MSKRRDLSKSPSADLPLSKRQKFDPAAECTSQTDGGRKQDRLKEDQNWKLWGPYLSERQWGTVREDYSIDGNCWEYFPHDHAPYRAYTSGEDGLMGICDETAQLCLSLALWNERDKMLKERLFGLTGPQGNHGEDVKECYYYLDNTPTHSYMKYLYKYPQSSFPYEELCDKNKKFKQLKEEKNLDSDEYELLDTGVFEKSGYWDVIGEYAKGSDRDILCRYTVKNRGKEAASIHILPTLWFRNTWSHNRQMKPNIFKLSATQVQCEHPELGMYVFTTGDEYAGGQVELLFTENETDNMKIASMDSHVKGDSEPKKKDAFNNYIVHGTEGSVVTRTEGTKCCAHYKVTVNGGDTATIKCRLVFVPNASKEVLKVDLEKQFDHIFNQKIKEADDFYNEIIPTNASEEERNVMRQAYAGMLWSKQIFIYDVNRWYSGQQQDNRICRVRNIPWKHMMNRDIISMPDKWEFPWYATWDLAFHMIPFIHLDIEFAKKQLLLFLSDRYMHLSGQLPAYEFEFSDTNPPIHAWAVTEVFRASNPPDVRFLKKAFMRLSLNFNWWVNQKRIGESHLFSGGFLGMDNISCVERSNPPNGTHIAQADATGWMAFFSGKMLEIALNLSQYDEDFEDMALRFLQEYLKIATDINKTTQEPGLWDPDEGFYFDRLTEGQEGKPVHHILKIKSMVGLVPLFGAIELTDVIVDKCAEIKEALQSAMKQTEFVTHDSARKAYLLSVLTKKQLSSVMKSVQDPKEFLSDYGIRSISKKRENNPFVLGLECPCEDGENMIELHSVAYTPGESNSKMFGGNSNWRGPIWICMNYLLIQCLEVYGKHWSSEYHTVAMDIASRIVNIFLPMTAGKERRRPVHGTQDIYSRLDDWKDLVLFYEYFHGDSGRGCGASHQTGWTGLVTNLIHKLRKENIAGKSLRS